MKKYLTIICICLISLTSIIFMVGCKKDKQPNSPSGNPSGEPSGNPSSEPSGNPSDEDKYYDITWVDDLGNVITTQSLKEGTLPAYDYDKVDTDEWDYVFKGWSETQNGEVLESIPSASENKTYYAVIDQIKKQYTLSFNVNGGSVVSPISQYYNEPIEAPENPTKEGYRFVCWCFDAALTTAVEWPISITQNTTLYASWNEVVDVKGYLSLLLEGYELNPYSYIPESMTPGYSANLINSSSVISDYSNFVNVSSIKDCGFGEQWHMITDNLQQSQTFFNVLGVVEGLTTSSIVTFNNYFDKNPSDTAHYSFENGEYNVTIHFDGEVIYYVLDFTSNIPILGEQTVQIALSMDIETMIKEVRIQLGDANALKYVISEDSYTFAIKYLGVRRAYFRVQKNSDNSIEGHINEYLTVSGIGTSSAADFYIDDEYVSVVGNKASGMIGFTGYISELYNTNTGKLLSYEVKETVSQVTYNTLWFNLSDISGITSIKYQEKTDSTDAMFYVNNSTNAWETKKVGGFSVKSFSRRFDIEFRTQYFYTYNAEEKTYEEVVVNVPMLFVQEENFDTLNSDVKSVNSNVNLNVLIANSDLAKLKEDYNTLIDIFIANKETITEELIIEFIGNRIEFN
ncbi:MAG: InlB B-repeat-containing protein [Bacilli bacterium]